MNQTDAHNTSVKESLMNTHKNPMITPTPNGTVGANEELLNKRTMSE